MKFKTNDRLYDKKTLEERGVIKSVNPAGYYLVYWYIEMDNMLTIKNWVENNFYNHNKDPNKLLKEIL